IRKIDELITPSHDLVVTTRQSQHGRLNSGFFVIRRPEILIDWQMRILEKAYGDPNILNEQDALCDIADASQYDVLEVPCAKYNYTKIEDGIPDDVKIVHMKKKRRFDKNLMRKVYEASPK